eukprot:CAMPEP_0184553958 /NCGR_PEP_ID=MMETSP0199_2-20130426/33677_1 /TAXON_ID=1112570 /ORGANISM="Thraustochytrium sp., Strain LLF1b" /LENGTH=140 /DNA_ID=CAMNT_0026949853 /DNA_START=145 /DNA_END=568 /DNA_ORIENTATION=+
MTAFPPSVMAIVPAKASCQAFEFLPGHHLGRHGYDNRGHGDHGLGDRGGDFDGHDDDHDDHDGRHGGDHDGHDGDHGGHDGDHGGDDGHLHGHDVHVDTLLSPRRYLRRECPSGLPRDEDQHLAVERCDVAYAGNLALRF